MTTLPIGRAFLMIQNRVYALPSAALYKHFDATTATFEVSNEEAGPWTDYTAIDPVRGKFARAVGADATISLFHQ